MLQRVAVVIGRNCRRRFLCPSSQTTFINVGSVINSSSLCSPFRDYSSDRWCHNRSSNLSSTLISKRSKSRISSTMPSLEYPKPRRSDVKDVLHGVTVEDPYRWMEDPDSEETKAFVDAQNNISKPLLETCAGRGSMRETLTKLWNYPRYSVPSKRGDRYYYKLNTGLQNQAVLYSKKDLNADPEVFLDPNALSEDGSISLSASAFSEHGNFYCYGLSESGSDWSTLYVKHAKTMKDLPDKIERFRYSSVSWTKDEKGFFYGQYPDWTGKVSGTESKAVENQKLYYHRLNTSQDEDVMVVEFPNNPKWRMDPEVSDCGKFLVLTVSEACQDQMVFIADISSGITGPLELKTIYGTLDCEINYIVNDGNQFYFQTNKGRPNYGLIKLDINKPDEWTDVIPEHPENVMEWITCVNNDKLVVGYLKDVATQVQVFSLTGNLLQTLPFELGTINEMSGKRQQSEVFFQFASFLTPGIIYRCEIDKAPNAVLEEFMRIKLNGVSTDDLQVKQVFYPSQDGTKVPMFIISRKDLQMDGNSPCMLYVYGGFNISVPPSFSLMRLMLVKNLGFSVAVANVRGGGEYGEKWHNSGRLKNKQNTLDDVHAAAAYLADEGYTKASKLALMGGSNGGMVTTASVNQRPDLFGAAVAAVPVTDMFRFHKFTVGHAWCSDYGNPDVEADFQVQFKYSPLHNIPTGIDNYPNLLVLTADHDDRVVPSHSLKFIAEAQHRLGEQNKQPLLTVIDTKAGHGGGKPTAKIIEEHVNIMCFLQIALDANYSA